MLTLISETQEIKIKEEPLSISATSLHKPTAIASDPFSFNCPRLSLKYEKKYAKIVELYIGCPAEVAFYFTINHLEPSHGKMRYF